MIYIKWKRGPCSDIPSTVYVSATRFIFQSHLLMPFVYWHGLRLRHNWEQNRGAVGLSIAANLRRKTTYSLSVWESETYLRQWLRSPYHAMLMRDYRERIEDSSVIGWQTSQFILDSAWKHALQRFNQPSE